MDRERDPDIFRKAEEFLGIFKKGVEFTQELLKENEKLRYRIVQLEEESHTIRRKMEGGDLQRLQEALQQLEQEKKSLLNRYREVEEENKDFATRYVEVEEENNNLANLYVASYQLHSTLDFKEVLRIIIEIIINLIGSDQFAILILDEETQVLTPVAAEGVDEKKLRGIRAGEGVIGRVAKTGKSHFEEDLDPKVVSEDHPLVCIPLMIKEKVIGAIAVFALFEQKKKKLTRVDHELFSMLAGHAATAIFSSRLYSQSERKLSTIQGFLDLLSGK